jgi:hypothetical protein
MRGGEFYDRGKISVADVVLEGAGVDISSLPGVQSCRAVDSTFQISQNLSLDDLHLVRSSFVRAGAVTVDVKDFSVADATVTVHGGDEFEQLTVNGGSLNTANLASGTVAVDHFVLRGSYNGIGADIRMYPGVEAVLAGQQYPTSTIGPGTVASFARLTAPTAGITVDNGSLFVGGDGASVVNNITASGTGIAVGLQQTSVEALALTDNAGMVLEPGSAITRSLTISGGAFLSLSTNLTCRDVTISGSGSSLRLNLSNVSARTLTIGGPTNLASRVGDTFEAIYLYDQANFIAAEDVSVATLNVDTASFSRDSHSITAGYLSLAGVDWTFAAGDSITNQLQLLRSTTFSLGADMSVPRIIVGSNSISSIVGNGHRFSTGIMQLFYGGTFTLQPGNSITQSVEFFGPSGKLVASTPISVQSVVFTGGAEGSNLTLAGFTGTSAAGAWGLQLPGNVASVVEADIAAGRITAPAAAGPLSVTYDEASSKTYVTVANPFAQQAVAAGQSLSDVSYTGESQGITTTASFAAGVAGENGSTITLKFLAPTSGLFSSRVDLGGTNNLEQVLQLTYDPADLTNAEQNELFLAWFRESDGVWVNSVLGNTGTNPGYTGAAWLGSWSAYIAAHPGATLSNSLGAFGVDTQSKTVWAAINHNSQFGVVASVPEPSTCSLALACLGFICHSMWRRLKRA